MKRPDSVMMVFEIKMSKIFTTVRAALSEQGSSFPSTSADVMLVKIGHS